MSRLEPWVSVPEMVMLPAGVKTSSVPACPCSSMTKLAALRPKLQRSVRPESFRMRMGLPLLRSSISSRAVAVPLVSWTKTFEVPSLRRTCREFDGEAVPMPTSPSEEMSTELVGAPGRMRKGRREPPVTSRTKKLASLPAMSQVCAVKPPELFCSRRMAGVLLVFTCRSSTGVEVRRPTRPVLSTKIELVAAPAVTVKGTLEPVMSSIENLLEPPLAESLAVSCQSLAGKPVPVLVSSNLMRVLFSFSRMVSKPKLSLLTQSRPTHSLPCTIRSSGMTWSAAVTGLGGRGAVAAAPLPGVVRHDGAAGDPEGAGLDHRGARQLALGPQLLHDGVVSTLPRRGQGSPGFPVELRHGDQLVGVGAVGKRLAVVADGVEGGTGAELTAQDQTAGTRDGQRQFFVVDGHLPLDADRADARGGQRGRPGGRRNRRQTHGKRQSRRRQQSGLCAL